MIEIILKNWVAFYRSPGKNKNMLFVLSGQTNEV